jgi:hypothetical protein
MTATVWPRCGMPPPGLKLALPQKHIGQLGKRLWATEAAGRVHDAAGVMLVDVNV